MMDVSLENAEFPVFENPFVTQTQSNPVTGPNTIPNLGEVTQAQLSSSFPTSRYASLTNQQKLDLFDRYDRFIRT